MDIMALGKTAEHHKGFEDRTLTMVAFDAPMDTDTSRWFRYWLRAKP